MLLGGLAGSYNLTYLFLALVGCSDEFVLGYIQLLDGERDPRNLLVAFSSVRIILQDLHFGMFLRA